MAALPSVTQTIASDKDRCYLSSVSFLRCKPAVWTPRTYDVTLTQLGRSSVDDRTPHVGQTPPDKHRIGNCDRMVPTRPVVPARHSDVAAMRTAPANDMSFDLICSVRKSPATPQTISQQRSSSSRIVSPTSESYTATKYSPGGVT